MLAHDISRHTACEPRRVEPREDTRICHKLCFVSVCLVAVSRKAPCTRELLNSEHLTVSQPVGLQPEQPKTHDPRRLDLCAGAMRWTAPQLPTPRWHMATTWLQCAHGWCLKVSGSVQGAGSGQPEACLSLRVEVGSLTLGLGFKSKAWSMQLISQRLERSGLGVEWSRLTASGICGHVKHRWLQIRRGGKGSHSKSGRREGRSKRHLLPMPWLMKNGFPRNEEPEGLPVTSTAER